MTIINHISKLVIYLFNYTKKVQEISKCTLISGHTVKLQLELPLLARNYTSYQ